MALPVTVGIRCGLLSPTDGCSTLLVLSISLGLGVPDTDTERLKLDSSLVLEKLACIGNLTLVGVGERGSDEVEADLILTMVPSLLAKVSAALRVEDTEGEGAAGTAAGVYVGSD